MSSELHLQKWSQSLDETTSFIENFGNADEADDQPSILITFDNPNKLYQTRKDVEN